MEALENSDSSTDSCHSDKQWVVDGVNLERYKFWFAMPCADRSLDAIYRYERPREHNRVAGIVHEVVECVHHIHRQNVIHGDISLLNIVRVNRQMRLIDFDASGQIGKAFSGCKFASGVLPPEMFYKFTGRKDHDMYMKHFAKVLCETPDLRKKIECKTRVTRNGGRRCTEYCVIRCFAHDVGKDGVNESLPYSLLPVSIAMDMWSLGLVIYSLCQGAPLFPVDLDNDLADSESYFEMESWNQDDSGLQGKLALIQNPLLHDLLGHMLNAHPQNRYKSMNEVLVHPFLRGSDGSALAEIKSIVLNTQQVIHDSYGLQKSMQNTITAIHSKTIDIKNLSLAMSSQLHKTETVLRKCIFESTEVLVPTCFMISPVKLVPEEDNGRCVHWNMYWYV